MSTEWLCVYTGLGLLLFGFFLGVKEGVRHVRAEAIRLGHAEWVAGKDGQPVFRWKEAKP